jgi:hypothetical protein
MMQKLGELVGLNSACSWIARSTWWKLFFLVLGEGNEPVCGDMQGWIVALSVEPENVPGGLVHGHVDEAGVPGFCVCLESLVKGL